MASITGSLLPHTHIYSVLKSLNKKSHDRKSIPSLPSFGTPSALQIRPRVTYKPRRQTTTVRSVVQEELQLEDPQGDVTKSSDDVAEFQWRSAWYAVLVESDADVARPHAVRVLGRPYVLWRDVTGTWRAFVDECPHRLVPLSEGRLDEEGRLQCSYHGWSFGPLGTCENIPQASPQGPEAAAKFSPRACAISVPVSVAQDVIFLWPDENGWEEANRTAPPVITEGLENFRFGATMRDLAYGYEMLTENVVDLSHLPFSHHGIAFLKRSLGEPLPLVVTEMKGPAGFIGSSDKDVFPTDKLFVEFKAPGRYSYDRRGFFGKPSRMITNLFLTPTSPGRSRVIVHQASSRPPPPFLPKFFQHLNTQDILDGDSFFLHAQERILQQKGADPRDWSKNFFMPCTADRYVVAFRQWFGKYAGGKVDWYGDVDTSLPTTWASREQVMDRLNGHTKHCVSCSQALQNVDRLLLALPAISIALLGIAALVRGNLAIRISLVLVAFLAAGSTYFVQQFRRKFVHVGYDHATR